MNNNLINVVAVAVLGHNDRGECYWYLELRNWPKTCGTFCFAFWTATCITAPVLAFLLFVCFIFAKAEILTLSLSEVCSKVILPFLLLMSANIPSFALLIAVVVAAYLVKCEKGKDAHPGGGGHSCGRPAARVCRENEEWKKTIKYKAISLLPSLPSFSFSNELRRKCRKRKKQKTKKHSCR